MPNIPAKTHLGCAVEYQWALRAIADPLITAVQNVVQGVCNFDWLTEEVMTFVLLQSFDEWRTISPAATYDETWPYGHQLVESLPWFDPAGPVTSHTMCYYEAVGMCLWVGAESASFFRSTSQFGNQCIRTELTDQWMADECANAFTSWWGSQSGIRPDGAPMWHAAALQLPIIR